MKEENIKKLIMKLRSEEWQEREIAAWEIGKIAEKGGDCSSAIPVLEYALNDEEEGVREGAIWALAKIAQKKVKK